jgi:DNA-binding MarR family transcriptional regulator
MPIRRSKKSSPANDPAGRAIFPEPAHPNISGPAGSPPNRFLIGAARQSGTGDPDSCRTVMAILAASRAIRRALDRELGTEELTESRFTSLVTLYAVAPLSATPADLAYHAQVSRASMTDVVAALEKHGWVERETGRDRRVRPLRITPLGSSVAVRAVHRFLHLASCVAGDLSLADRRITVATSEQIELRAGQPEAV